VGAVGQVKVRWGEQSIRLTAVPRSPGREMRLDLWGASRKSGLLAKVAGVPVYIIDPDGKIVSEDSDDGADE
jgi:hypothetical protein